ncbi:MAG: GIY-YIG nuclease family protein [Epsilonproteobacteria bacterium]|nr:GIY-YIG nuclease family protein [Campylobacterota bacterium]
MEDYLSDTYSVYILECSDKTLYTGITKDLTKRLAEHNSSDRGAKYTKSRRPVRVIYVEEASDKSSALKRECAIKRLSRVKKLELSMSLEIATVKSFVSESDGS